MGWAETRIPVKKYRFSERNYLNAVIINEFTDSHKAIDRIFLTVTNFSVPIL